MPTRDDAERDELRRVIREHAERIQWLEARLNEPPWRDAERWIALCAFRTDLASSLIDEATNDAGEIARFVVDARQGGETFIPVSMSKTERGRRYRLELRSTRYNVERVDDAD